MLALTLPPVRSFEFTLPSSWASYLVNGDASGLELDEIAACDRFCARMGLSASGCVSCGDEFFSRHNDTGSLAGNVCEFLFLKS